MATSTTRDVSAAEQIDQVLTREILRGDHRPGARLAPVRELAQRFQVNPATMQRALARLESKGLIDARQGSGLLVNDPVECGDLSLLPDWLAACADDPDRSGALLGELLAMRRATATQLLVHHRLAVLDVLGDLSGAAAAMASLASADAMTVDLALARTVVRATGTTLPHAVLSSFERALREAHLLVEAVYGEPARNARSLQRAVEALRDGGPELASQIADAFEAVDVVTVERYVALLRSPAR